MRPQDLSIGIRDVLALLVPGAILLIVLPVETLGWLQGRVLLGGEKPDAALFILVFLAAATATGSLLSGAAGLADDYVDDYIRWRAERLPSKGFRGVLSRQIHKLEQSRMLAADLERQINPVISGAADEDGRPWTTRSFWWNYLRLKCPEAIAELDRIEGIQKQFRSLVLVALTIAIANIVTVIDGGRLLADPWQATEALREPGPWLIFILALGACGFCFFSYVGYRVRFARRLYELALIHALPNRTIAQGSETFFRVAASTGYSALVVPDGHAPAGK